MKNPVLSKYDLLHRIRLNQKIIQSYGVRKLGIFGSFSRDQVTESSDVDFYVIFDPSQKTLHNFLELARFLEDITGRKIELVTPQSLSKYIGPFILKELEYVSLAA